MCKVVCGVYVVSEIKLLMFLGGRNGRNLFKFRIVLYEFYKGVIGRESNFKVGV